MINFRQQRLNLLPPSVFLVGFFFHFLFLGGGLFWGWEGGLGAF